VTTVTPALRLTGDGAIRQEPLRRLLLRQVAEMHAAEKDALQVLAELAAAARSPRLGLLLRLHVAETREHITRLRHIMDRHGVPAGTLGSRGKRGLLEDCIELACSEADDPTVRDTALAAVALHLEHDEIASYQVLRMWASQLGMHDASDALGMTMGEEQRLESRLIQWSAAHHRASQGRTAFRTGE
jgi:ferritin-like metal-binding protein YciE